MLFTNIPSFQSFFFLKRRKYSFFKQEAGCQMLDVQTILI